MESKYRIKKEERRVGDSFCSVWIVINREKREQYGYYEEHEGSLADCVAWIDAKEKGYLD
jgi:hypothetical protein